MKRLLALAALLSVGALSPAQVSASRLHTVIHDPRHRWADSSSTSSNWSGYDITGSGATHVIGTWTQPSVTCSAGENSWSSPWVGLDGDTSNTVEQTGTDSDCSGGKPTYYAWYEMYPKNAVILPMKVTPGHTYTGSVTYSGGLFTLSLTDNTTKVTNTEHLSSKKAKRSSVEWILEGPSNGLLTDFGSDPFTAASATINGTTAGLTAFGSSAQSITMVNSSGTVRAQPSSVSNNGFTDTWLHG
jgi:hypothetical protein